MNVLLFCNLVPDKRGAFERLAAAIGRALTAGGDRFAVAFAAAPCPEVAADLAAAKVAWHTIGEWLDRAGNVRPWRFCRPALRLLRAERPAVAAVHFGNELPSLAVSLAAPLAGAPGVRWVWQQDQRIEDPSWLTRRVSRLALLRPAFAHFVAVYEGGRESLLRRGIPSARVTVIRNAVADDVRERPAGWLRRALGLRPEAVLALGIGSLIARKRVDFQLQAVARAAVSAPDLHLGVVGDGPERSALERLAGTLGIAGRVSFLGRRADVRALLPEADLLLHSAVAEAGAYVIPEAMCAGLPAVVTRAGAASEQVDDGRTGFVLARDDLAGFANRLAQLASDPSLRRSLGAAARQRWAERYRLNDAARAYADLYRRVARGG